MSNPHLPPEILDYILDLLQDDQETLRKCSLVAKPWVSRTRKHLFAKIEFRSPVTLELWKKTFPDQASSPAQHTRILFIGCVEVVTAADAEQDDWIRTISRIARSRAHSNPPPRPNYLGVSLVPFHGFSPILRYLRILSTTLQNSQIFDLISSLPLLENLTLGINGIDDNVLNSDVLPTVLRPSTSPALTGALDLALFKGMGPIARRLLGLPNGLHFRKLTLSWFYEEDLQWMIALVAKCSHTLESLGVSFYSRSTSVTLSRSTCSSPSPVGNSGLTSIDLSTATKLENVIFFSTSLNVERITLALRTITPGHRDLRQICIHLPYDRVLISPGVIVRQIIERAVCDQWLALDHVLVQLWGSHSIRSKITYITSRTEREGIDESMEWLLPETMKRGIIDLVERRRSQ